MNVCSDYLALLLAAPGQLVSVSWLARDPWLNPAAERVGAMHVNRGSAEDVLPLAADLVLAGTTTTPQTVQLLQRLGVRVVSVPYVTSLGDVTSNIRIVAGALGRSDAGEAMIASLLQQLAASAAGTTSKRAVVAIYGAGGRVAGSQSLAGDVAAHAGYDNLGDRLGSDALSVEDLLFARPDLIVVSPARSERRSLAQLAVEHPALA